MGSWGIAWWDILLRGLITIVFGIALFFWPGLSLKIFIILFAGFAFMDGVLLIVQSVSIKDSYWWVRLLHGLLGIFAAMFAVAWPGLTLLLFTYLIAIYWAFTGIFQIFVGFEARKAMKGELLLIGVGLIAMILGVILLLRPVGGVTVLAQVIGVFSVVFGSLMVLLAVKLKLMGGGAPAPV